MRGKLAMRQPQYRVMEEKPDMRAIKAKAKLRFGNLAGVEGFGVGSYVLRIYVTNASLKDVIPSRFQGVPVDLVISGNIVAR